MWRSLGIVGLALASASCAPPPPQPPTMSALQHCQLAATLAYNGECFLAGQHLSFCDGVNRDATYAYAQRMCSAPRASATAVATPAPINGTVRPAPAPAVATPRPSGTDACADAVQEALFGGCADALRSLEDCRGEHHDEAKTKVDHWCSRTPLPDSDVDSDVFRSR